MEHSPKTEDLAPNLIQIYRKWFELENLWETEKAEICYKMPANIALKDKELFADHFWYYLSILWFSLLATRKLWDNKNKEALELLNEYINLLYRIEKSTDDWFVSECLTSDIQITEWALRTLWQIQERQCDSLLLEQRSTFYQMLIDAIESENKVRILRSQNI